MRELEIKNVAGFQLIQEFSKRVVLDEYDSFVAENNELESLKVEIMPEGSAFFDRWLKEESDLLYDAIMLAVNNYIQTEGISSPEL